MTKLREHFIRVHNFFLQLLYKFQKFFLWPNGCWKFKFLNKRQKFQWRKDYGLFVPVLLNMTNARERFIGVHEVIWIFCAKDKIILLNLRSRLKQTFKERAVITRTNVFGPCFLVLSSVTNLKEQFTKVHKPFLTLLCNS